MQSYCLQAAGSVRFNKKDKEKLQAAGESEDLDCGLRDADLVFVRSGNGKFSSAISEATTEYAAKSDFDHVGIITRDSDSLSVIEARPVSGVIMRSLRDFVEENGAENVVFMRLDMPLNASAVVNRARGFIGRPYDEAFLPGDERIYCSELVQLSFIDHKGHPIFGMILMNFRRPDGTMPEFWIDHYARLGIPIPEGAPGSNPNQIASDPMLKVIEHTQL